MKHVQASFQAAVEILVADGPVKHRLAQAFECHLADLGEKDLPVIIRDRYCKLSAAMHTQRPVGPQSSIRATVQKMSIAEASNHARSIVEMFVEILGKKARSEPLKVNEPLQFVDRGVAAAPRFLAKKT